MTEALILHWNGHSWEQFENPDPGSVSNDLSSVRAVSASDVWAVGSFSNGLADRALILHWNGTRWGHMASPNLGSSNDLNGVAAISSSTAWAVGTFDSAIREALAIHCC